MASIFGRSSDRWIIALVLTAATGVAVLVGFQLATDIPVVDEVGLRWTVERLVGGHGLHLFPTAAPLALPQTAAAALIELAHPAPQLLRLSIIPFLAAAGAATTWLARRLTAGWFESMAAALAVTLSPLTLALSTGMASEVAYIGLALPALALMARWIESGRRSKVLFVLVILAALQRQYAVGLAPALTVALFVAGRRRRVAPSEWVSVGLVWLVLVGAVVSPLALSVASEGARGVLGNAAHIKPGYVAGAVVELPLMLGLLLAPLAVLVVGSGRPTLAAASRLEYIPVSLGAGAVLAAATFSLHFGTIILPGDWLTAAGLGPVELPGPKPLLISGSVLGLAEFAIVASSAAILFGGRRGLVQVSMTPIGTLLLVFAATQLVATLLNGVIDRYFLPPVAALAPLVAVAASRAAAGRGARLVGRGSAIVVLLLGVTFYALGEQDYQAWTAARDSAARSAYTHADPASVNAGYETDATYRMIPSLDRTGRLPQPKPIELQLEFGSNDEARSGFRYKSAASGVIVIRTVR